MKTRLSLLAAAALFGFITTTAMALTVSVSQDTSSNVHGRLTSGAGKASLLAVSSSQVALVDFKLSNLNVVPSAIDPEQVKSALLVLYIVSTSTNADLTVHLVTSPWSETFKPATEPLPSISPTTLTTIPSSALPSGFKGFVSVDITQAVVAALQTGTDLDLAIESSVPHAVTMLGSKDGPASGYAAQIDIEADLTESGAVTGADIANGAVGSAELAPNLTLAGDTTVEGEISLPATDATGTNGVLDIGGVPFLSAYGVQDTFIGGAGNFSTTGNGNTGMGFQALLEDGAGGSNTAMGVNALLNDSSGNSNTAVGDSSLGANQAGSYNTGIGVATLSNATGNNNVAFGYDTGHNNQTGSDNIYVGNADSNGVSTDGTDESNTIRIGAPDQHTSTYIAGINGVALTGGSAVYVMPTGQLGVETPPYFDGQLPNGSTAVGQHALQSSTGQSDTAIGTNALYDLGSTSDGSGETALGEGALFDLGKTTNVGDDNTAVGRVALFQLGSLVGGAKNTAVGVGSLQNLGTSGTGSYNLNVAVGWDAGTTLDSGTGNIYIGNRGPTSGNTESGVIRIGASPGDSFLQPITSTYIAGIYGASYNGNDTPAAVFIDSTGKLGTVSVTPSSRAYKKDIKPMGDASDVILSLKPVMFQYIKPEFDPRGGQEFGLIAEEVEKICPSLVAHNKDGAVYGIRYDAVYAMLLNEFLKEHQRVEDQGKTIAALGQSNTGLAKRIAMQDQINSEQEKQIQALTASIEKMTLQMAVVAQRLDGKDYQPVVNHVASVPSE